MPRGTWPLRPGREGEGRKAGSGVGALELELHVAPHGICRLQLQQLQRRREEGWRVVRRAGAPARKEGGGPRDSARRARGVLGAPPPSFRELGCRL